MYNENTIKDMEVIDKMISNKNFELAQSDTKLFLSWTFPTNHAHEAQTISENYFIVWVGEIGKGHLKMVCIYRIGGIEKILDETSETDLREILDSEPFERR